MRICFVGDSFVNGIGDPECLGWTGRLIRNCWARGHEVTYYNLGIRRNTSEQIASRCKSEISRRLPEDIDGRVVFSFGTNDTTIEQGECRVPKDQSIANFRRILSEAQSKYPTLMIGPPPILDSDQDQRTHQIDQAYSEHAKELDVPYLSVFQELRESTDWESEIRNFDGAHPQEKGYDQLASMVESWNAWKQWFV